VADVECRVGKGSVDVDGAVQNVIEGRKASARKANGS
jgi:hypothetical protein